jgi:hypothetical protein
MTLIALRFRNDGSANFIMSLVYNRGIKYMAIKKNLESFKYSWLNPDLLIYNVNDFEAVSGYLAEVNNKENNCVIRESLGKEKIINGYRVFFNNATIQDEDRIDIIDNTFIFPERQLEHKKFSAITELLSYIATKCTDNDKISKDKTEKILNFFGRTWHQMGLQSLPKQSMQIEQNDNDISSQYFPRSRKDENNNLRKSKGNIKFDFDDLPNGKFTIEQTMIINLIQEITPDINAKDHYADQDKGFAEFKLTLKVDLDNEQVTPGNITLQINDRDMVRKFIPSLPVSPRWELFKKFFIDVYNSIKKLWPFGKNKIDAEIQANPDEEEMQSAQDNAFNNFTSSPDNPRVLEYKGDDLLSFPAIKKSVKYVNEDSKRPDKISDEKYTATIDNQSHDIYYAEATRNDDGRRDYITKFIFPNNNQQQCDRFEGNTIENVLNTLSQGLAESNNVSKQHIPAILDLFAKCMHQDGFGKIAASIVIQPGYEIDLQLASDETVNALHDFTSGRKAKIKDVVIDFSKFSDSNRVFTIEENCDLVTTPVLVDVNTDNAEEVILTAKLKSTVAITENNTAHLTPESLSVDVKNSEKAKILIPSVPTVPKSNNTIDDPKGKNKPIQYSNQGTAASPEADPPQQGFIEIIIKSLTNR